LVLFYNSKVCSILQLVAFMFDFLVYPLLSEHRKHSPSYAYYKYN
jgi:hypothetical protein